MPEMPTGMPTIEQNMTALLKQIGDPGTCRGCNAPIWWVVHKNGKAVPYTNAGLNHFINCEKSADFRRKR